MSLRDMVDLIIIVDNTNVVWYHIVVSGQRCCPLVSFFSHPCQTECQSMFATRNIVAGGRYKQECQDRLCFDFGRHYT